MSNTINILVNVDALTTINNGTTPAARVFMVDDQPNDQGQGTTELTLNAHIGDAVNWYIDCIQPGYQAVIQSFDFTSGVNPLGQGPQPVDGVWTGVIQQSTQQSTYHCNFLIFSPSGIPSGPYWWDPFIVVP